MPIQVALFTVGDRYVSGGSKDEAGDNLNASCLKMGWEVVLRQALGDDEQGLAGHLIQTADSGPVDIIFTVDGIGLAGVRGKTIVINMPGSPTAIKDSMDVLRPVIRMAVDQVKGTPS